MTESAILYKSANGVDRVPMRASDGDGPVPWWLVVSDPFTAEGAEGTAATPSDDDDEHGQHSTLEGPPEPLAATGRAAASVGVATAAAPSQPPARGEWKPELTQWVLRLKPDELPKRFSLRQGCVVVDRVRFLASLQADVRRGPSGPRARFGALQADLAALHDILTKAD